MVQCQWLRFSSRRVVPISEFHPSKFVNVQEAVLARTWHEGNLLPGYALLGQNAGYFVDDNCMVRKTELTDLHIISGNANMWKLHQEGQELPGTAIQIGKTNRNEPLAIMTANCMAVLMEEIALEGLDGITLEGVGSRGEPSFLSKVAAQVCGDDFFRAQPAQRVATTRRGSLRVDKKPRRCQTHSNALQKENLFEWQGPRKPFPPRLKCGVVAPDEVINSYLAAPSAGNATPRPDASSTTPQFWCRQLHVCVGCLVANRRSFQKLRQKSVVMTSSGHSLPSGSPPQGEAVCASTKNRVVVRRIPTPFRSKRRAGLACLLPVPRETPGDQKLLSASVSAPMENLFEWQGPRKPFPPRLKCGVVAPDEVINSYLAAPSAGNATPRPDASSTTPLFLCRQLHLQHRAKALMKEPGSTLKTKKCLNLAFWQRCWRTTQLRCCCATSV
ncbi:Hypothetical predicted protein [Cloeon dipterum]|uniref:Uncharacterized protein n=1 Tax=Cloeon dipterum TaxID=197152 RepID=A0A8S1DYE3_9INSE|nr:Hypothetical predicted protein [Cloeon dipterum]